MLDYYHLFLFTTGAFNLFQQKDFHDKITEPQL